MSIHRILFAGTYQYETFTDDATVDHIYKREIDVMVSFVDGLVTSDSQQALLKAIRSIAGDLNIVKLYKHRWGTGAVSRTDDFSITNDDPWPIYYHLFPVCETKGLKELLVAMRKVADVVQSVDATNKQVLVTTPLLAG